MSKSLTGARSTPHEPFFAPSSIETVACLMFVANPKQRENQLRPLKESLALVPYSLFGC